MHRRPLLELLERYEGVHPEESHCVARIRELVRNHSDCFDRRCLPGHVTASAWIVSSDADRFLLTHHRKLDRWLQLGGHADGDGDVQAVALREAREESGLSGFVFLGRERAGEGDRRSGIPVVPVDVDVHRIPARPGEPAHEHHDIRFVLQAPAGERISISDESNALEWFEWDRLEKDFDEESLLRLGRKARQVVSEKRS
jgi:8-oxo-dGTP pyrophosphatase MutT (NUDIX family)